MGRSELERIWLSELERICLSELERIWLSELERKGRKNLRTVESH